MATVVAVTTFFTLAIMVTVAVVIAVVASMNKWKNPHTFGGDFVAPGLSKTTPTFPT